jgi:hypothetical protein
MAMIAMTTRSSIRVKARRMRLEPAHVFDLVMAMHITCFSLCIQTTARNAAGDWQL